MLWVDDDSSYFVPLEHEMKLRLLGVLKPLIIRIVHFVAVDHNLEDARKIFAPKPGEPNGNRRLVHGYLTNSRIALSKPSSVRGYIRPPRSWRMMGIDWV